MYIIIILSTRHYIWYFLEHYSHHFPSFCVEKLYTLAETKDKKKKPKQRFLIEESKKRVQLAIAFPVTMKALKTVQLAMAFPVTRKALESCQHVLERGRFCFVSFLRFVFLWH